jgi:hypothetical protein
MDGQKNEQFLWLRVANKVQHRPADLLGYTRFDLDCDVSNNRVNAGGLTRTIVDLNRSAVVDRNSSRRPLNDALTVFVVPSHR